MGKPVCCGPVLTSPNVVRHWTVFMSPHRKWLCPDPDGTPGLSQYHKLKYKGYLFERVFVLCCDVKGGVFFFERIINNDESVVRGLLVAAGEPGWKYIAWSPLLGYHAEPVTGPDWALGPCDEGDLLTKLYGTLDTSL